MTDEKRAPANRGPFYVLMTFPGHTVIPPRRST